MIFGQKVVILIIDILINFIWSVGIILVIRNLEILIRLWEFGLIRTVNVLFSLIFQIRDRIERLACIFEDSIF